MQKIKRVALVTGSSKGIGKGIAKKLLEKGYIVYINGRDKEQVNKTVKKFNTKNAKSLVVDLNEDINIAIALQDIVKNETRLDLVVCNIGSGKSKIGLESDIKEYRRVFDINYFNSVSLALEAIEYMKNSGGNIIFISSIAGCESLGAPITYSSAKTALLSFSKNLSNEIAKYNIRVNCISPGNVMFKHSTWDIKLKEDKERVENYIETNVPLNRFATPKDIAKGVLFLEKNNFITGSNIVIDGGQVNKVI